MYRFYKNYELRFEFCIAKRSNHKKDDLCYHYSFACNKHKKIIERDSYVPPLPERNQPVLGTECKAMLTIVDLGFLNRWVTKFHLEHSHVLTPDSSYLITTYHEIHVQTKRKNWKQMMTMPCQLG